MRATPVLLVVAAFLVAGCASNSNAPELGPLADQADRVAQLIDEERPCEAVEAARALGALGDDDRLGEQVTQAVTSFAASAESSIECPPATTAPATEPPPSPASTSDADADADADRDEDEEKEKDEEGDKDEDEEGDNKDEGNGDDEHPGEGKAKGKAGDPGRGNDDD